MPRPNPPRSLQSEQNLARRIAHERERRGWTYEGTAKRMTDAGCPIQSTAIYKIEKAEPPRRISVDELVGFSKVFDIPVEQLLIPEALVQQEALRDLLVEWELARAARQKADEDEAVALEAVQAYMREHADMEPTLQAFMRNWAEQSFREPDAAHAYWMATFTGSPDWHARLGVESDRIADKVEAKTKRKAKTRG